MTDFYETISKTQAKRYVSRNPEMFSPDSPSMEGLSSSEKGQKVYRYKKALTTSLLNKNYGFFSSLNGA